MQKEITKSGPLLNSDGHLIEKGYARSLLLNYDRKMIKAHSSRIKEWDYYLIYNDDYAIALTLDDNSYMGMISVSLINFKEVHEITKSKIIPFTNGKMKMPSSSKFGSVSYQRKNLYISFQNEADQRILNLTMPNFHNGSTLKCHLVLTNEPKESIVISTPFHNKPKAFYYNQKIVGFSAEGQIELGDLVINLKPNTTYGLLDWGRGVWTYQNTWYWGALASTINGHQFGFNIGYGFGDTTTATENALFYDGQLHKLEHVVFNIPKDEKGKELYTNPWTFTSSDQRFELSFTPIIDRYANLDVLIIGSCQHQVFGRFNGKVILDNGQELIVHNLLGFAEKVTNKW